MAYLVDKAAKPAAFAQLERWLGGGGPDQLVERIDLSLAALDEPDPEAWLAQAGDLDLDLGEQAGHFLRDWLGDEGYWPSVPAGTRVEAFRAGLIRAYRDARERRVPLSFVWVTPESIARDTWSVEHVAGPVGVTVVFLTSPPETGPSAY